MKGTLIWHPTVREDERGFFAELWKSGDGDKKFGQIEQINMSRSREGVLRGMHLQQNIHKNCLMLQNILLYLRILLCT